ncbi:MAG: diguanylate cyclase [Treponema sp.]|nr:diguanylate cyclase [Treponema sp.]
MKLLLDNAPNVLILLDKKLRITHCSVRFLKLMNIASLDKVRGIHILDVYRQFMDEEFVNKARPHIQHAVISKKTVIFEASITIKSSGKLCLYVVQTTPLIDESDAMNGFCIIFHPKVEKMEDIFFVDGVDDFVDKPIEYNCVNRTPDQGLPATVPQYGDLLQDILNELRCVEGLDVENGVSYTGDSIGNYLKILRQFCQGFDERKTAILISLEKEDWKNYLVYIHSFKGATAALGIQQLSDKAEALETLAKGITDNEPAAQTLRSMCEVETKVFLFALNAFKEKTELILGDLSQLDKNPIDTPALIERLKTLEEACGTYEVNQAAEIATELATVAYSKTMDKELDNVVALASSLDYEQTVVKIEQLMEELSKPAPPSKSHILIIDDDKVNHLILDGILASEYELTFTYTAKEAFIFIETEKPDVVLLDIMLPEMDGFDFLKELKSRQETASIPVIVITSLNGFEDEEKVLSLGAVDFIMKPFRPAVVKARIKNQLSVLQHFRTLEKVGFIDELTGIPNRRFFNDRIAVEWKRAERDQKTLSFCMIDVDKFKDYNDTYGHLQGDALLQAVAKVFSLAARRATDFTARLGGEEFGVLLTDASIEAAVEIAEQIRKSIQNLTVLNEKGEPTSVTVSIGVASGAPHAGFGYRLLLAQADAYLYLAKSAGRNNVCSPLHPEGV